MNIKLDFKMKKTYFTVCGSLIFVLLSIGWQLNAHAQGKSGGKFEIVGSNET